jgi:hypothetical protein
MGLIRPAGIAFVQSQLRAAKVSRSNLAPNWRKFRRHFKGAFWNGNMEVRILPGQPTSPGGGETDWDSDRKARQWRAFANWP